MSPVVYVHLRFAAKWEHTECCDEFVGYPTKCVATRILNVVMDINIPEISFNLSELMWIIVLSL